MKALARTELDEPFAERVDRLARELELAIRWDRSSILLAVYSSMYVMGDAAAALEAQLREGGQQVVWVRVNGEADADIPMRLAEHPQRNGAVFFVSGLQWGGQTALRALNIRREYFVDERLRAVFWLTENEAVAIARQAPDFWAFRHRVVEFVEPPEPGWAAEMARGLAWRGFEDRTLRQNTQAKIALREALLADLPESDETLAARAELLFTLGGLYGADHQYERAEESFLAALEEVRRMANARLEAWCHNGLGNVYHALGRHREAIAAYQQSIELDPEYAYPHNGLGNVYADLGLHEEAVAEYRRAIELDLKFAHPHNGLGNIYAALGRHEEAVAKYQRAIELDPQYAYPHNGLGNVYSALGRYEEAIAEYQRAMELDPKLAAPHHGLGSVYYDLGRYEEAIAEYQRALELNPKFAPAYFNWALAEVQRNNVDTALEQLKRAIALKPEEAIERARKASEFDSIRHDPRFQALVGGGSDTRAQEGEG
jgi:tetratricopeptide (TPR) repeat protein